MNYLIVEDSAPQSCYIKDIIEKEFPDSNCSISNSYASARNMILTNDYQVFILDIDLGSGNDETGIEIGKLIRETPRFYNAPILFTTSIPERMPEAINNIHCYSYLVKPYSQDTLINSLKSLQSSSLVSEEILTFREPNGLYFRLKPSEIIYVEVYSHTLHIYTSVNVFRTNDCTIKNFCQLMPNTLVQCHKSFAVNLRKIDFLSNSEIVTTINSKDIRIPIGRIYKDALLERYKK